MAYRVVSLHQRPKSGGPGFFALAGKPFPDDAKLF